MTARDEAVAAELVRAHHVIEDQANELHAKDATISSLAADVVALIAEKDRHLANEVILRAVLTQIRDGARDPVSLAEIGLREAGT